MQGNFFSQLQAATRDASDMPFLTTPNGDSHTYGEIDGLSAKIAGALRALGARRGDRIAVQIEKSPENVALYLAALRAGLVYLPLNPAYTPEEIAYFISDAEPAIFVCDPTRENTVPRGCRVLTLGADSDGSLIEAANQAPSIDGVVPRQEDDLAVILYTSGTTGRSKGAMLTNRNLRSNAEMLHKIWGFVPGDVLLHALPIFHIHGLFIALHTAMLNASEVLFLPKFDIAEVRRAMKTATVMMGVPTFYTRLLAEPDFGRDDSANMRLFISGSAPLTAEIFMAFEERTGVRILERYGMSEAGMIAGNPLSGERVAGTVGYALPGVELRVTDGERILPAGEAGVVEVRGPNVFSGYWRMPEKTAEAFRDGGWFSTGDVGFLAEDGRLTLSGRAKDIVIVGGYNVYPKEIEEILDALPGVAESAVIGVPHPDMGEGVIAVLIADANVPDDATLKSAVAVLARFKQPRKFIWLDALPRNAMGKVQKQVLREQFRDVFKKS